MKKILDFLSKRKYISGMKKPVCHCGCNTITVDNETGTAICSLCGNRARLVLLMSPRGTWIELADERKCPGNPSIEWCSECRRFTKEESSFTPELLDDACLDFEEME